MNELIRKMKDAAVAAKNSMKAFYARNRMLVWSGATILSILLVVWARLGFSLQFGRSEAVGAVNISASPQTVDQGGETVINWTILPGPLGQNCVGQSSPNNPGFTFPSIGPHGPIMLELDETTTFTVKCRYITVIPGSFEDKEDSVTVTVRGTGSQTTATLSASPGSVPPGGTVTLTWSSTNATSCTVLAGNFGPIGTSGTKTEAISPSTPSGTVVGFRISCTGTGGTVQSNVANVTVSGAPVTPSVGPSPTGGTCANNTNCSACPGVTRPRLDCEGSGTTRDGIGKNDGTEPCSWWKDYGQGATWCTTCPFTYRTAKAPKGAAAGDNSEATWAAAGVSRQNLCQEKPDDCPDGWHAWSSSWCEKNAAATPTPTPTPAGTGSLSVQCGTQNALTWTYDSRANSNSIERGNTGAKNLPECADYWCWLPTSTFSHQTPTAGSPAHYTDTQLQSGVCYEYRIKYRPELPSNSVFCPTNCNVAPTPTPTATSTPTATAPVPTVTPVACAPLSQTVAVGQAANLQASGGSGGYQWSSDGQSRQGAQVSFTYSTLGTKDVQVQSAGSSSSCEVQVQEAAQPSMSETVTGRNVSTGGPEGTTVGATCNQQIETVTRVRNDGSANLANVVVRASLPGGLTYVGGSTTVDNAPTGVESVTTSGLSIGGLGPGQTSTVAFRTRANCASFPVGTSQAVIVVQASADGVADRSGSLTVQVTRPGGTAGAPGVQTGPGEAVLVALLVSGIVTLLYVTYTRSPGFRRREAEGLSEDQGPMDFRS